MNALNSAIRRELRIAFSPRAQPVWFRAIKWTCILAGAVLFHDQGWFWWTLAGLAAVGTLWHFFYRWKTKGWTHAWGAGTTQWRAVDFLTGKISCIAKF